MHIYKNIWITPNKALNDYVGVGDNRPFAFLPIIILGISIGLDIKSGFASVFGTNEIIPIAVGVILSFLLVSLLAPGLIFISGKIWKGKATWRQLINIVSISVIPQALILLYQLFLMATDTDPVLSNVNGGFQYMIKLWSFGLLIIGVAKIQNFNYPKALMNILVGYSPILLYLLISSL